jgi:hypothetical protein
MRTGARTARHAFHMALSRCAQMRARARRARRAIERRDDAGRYERLAQRMGVCGQSARRSARLSSSASVTRLIAWFMNLRA